MIDTVLFDLDGTLLPMDLDKFLASYFGKLAVHLKDLIIPNDLPRIMMDCTEEMIRNDEHISNQDVFFNRFKQHVSGDLKMYTDAFEAFYHTAFQEVKETTWINEDIIKAVQVLKDKGYKLVVATNPLFPMIANHYRIKWAGLDPLQFSHITSFEENHYCKPNPKFYLEVLGDLKLDPSNTMMVGNDYFEDTVAEKVGIKTYLITDNLVERHEKKIEPSFKGTYRDFLEFAKSLQSVE